MVVHVVGDDPVREEVVAALGDVDVGVQTATVDELSEASFGIVTDVAGSDRFGYANVQALEGETPWIAVEVGGVGGKPMTDVDAAVSAFGPETGCFQCLQARVASTRGTYTTTANPRAERAAVRLAGAIAGREAVRILEDADETLLGSVIEVPYRERRVWPIPVCRCDRSGRDRSLDLADEDTLSLDAAAAAAELAVDDRLGPVISIGEAESYPAPYYITTAANTQPYSEAKVPENAAGVDADWNAAFVKAIGESLERYCAGVYREHDFTVASAEEIDTYLEPAAFVRPDDVAPFDPTEEYRWVDGVSLADGESISLPADAVHFPQPGDGLVPQITTGLGLGSSTADAIISGLGEVIERDATMLAWYSTFEPLGLEVDDEAFETLERRVSAEGMAVTPLLVTQDVDVPVVAVAVHRSDGDVWPAFAMGSAAGLDGVEAARSALAEAVQNWMELRSIGRDEAGDAGAWIGEYASFPSAARDLIDVEKTVTAASVGPENPPEGAAAVDALVERAVEAGLTPYAARVTARDVEEIGFEAVRVVIPEAQPLFTDEPYFGDRAETVPADLGYEPVLDREPHPYP